MCIRDRHGAEGAEKFIQEVIWRGYFKGWMERRPVVWDQYREGLIRDLMALDRDRGLRRRVEAAEAGQAGLDYFDNWAAQAEKFAKKFQYKVFRNDYKACNF